MNNNLNPVIVQSVANAMRIVDAHRPMPVMSQRWNFDTLIGQGCDAVTVWYDHDDDTNSINDMAVTTGAGVLIDQYLTDDQLAQLEMDCYVDLEKQIEREREEELIDIGEARYLDRMAA